MFSLFPNKILDISNLRKKWFPVAHSSREQSIVTEKPWWQKQDTAVHMALQSGNNVIQMQILITYTSLFSLGRQHMEPKWFPPKLTYLKTLSHGHIFLISNPVKLTNNTNHFI